MSRKTIAFLLLLVILAFSSFTLIRRELAPVYKDRPRWEQTGQIIWEFTTPIKLIALTFDDGPSPTFTPQLLQLLAEYHAKASFFITGEQAAKFPEILKNTAKQGHTIGNHLYSHQRIEPMSLETLILNLDRTHRLILKITGKPSRFFRPPDGYYDEKIVQAAATLNYQVIIWTWTQDTRDWSKIPAYKIAGKVIKNAHPGDIILMHDRGGDRSNTINALKIILPTLTERGYRFVSLEEMVKDGRVTNRR